MLTSSSTSAATDIDYVRLSEHFQRFTKLHKAVVKQGGILSTEATAAAQSLANVAHEIRIGIRNAEDMSAVERYLKGSECVLPLAYKLTTLLVDPNIQFLQDLKHEMSEAARSLMEIGVLQCTVQGARTYEDTIKVTHDNLRKVIKTLPKTQALTEFNLKLTNASLRGLDFGKGKWRELGRRHGLDIAQGVLDVIFTASPVPPFINVGPLAPPVMRLIGAIYDNTEFRWYKVVQILQFGTERGALKQADGFREVRQLLARNGNDYKLAFYVTTLFDEMLHDDNCTDLRDEIISGGELSLKTLSERQVRTINPLKKRNEDKFWRVRYNTVRVLGRVSGKDDIVLPLILARATAPRERDEVRDLAVSIVAARVTANASAVAMVSTSIEQAKRPLSVAQTSLAERGAVSAEAIGAKLSSIDEERVRLRELFARGPQAAEGKRVNESIGDQSPSASSSSPAQEFKTLADVEARLIDRDTRRLAIEALQQEFQEVAEAQRILAEIENALATNTWTAFGQQ